MEFKEIYCDDCESTFGITKADFSVFTFVTCPICESEVRTND